MSKYLEVVNWAEDDLLYLPEVETDEYEYKSSRISDQNIKQYKKGLKEDIYKAASAFWNSGGGYLIVGIDDEGNVDGGIPPKMGNQSLMDWVDQVIHEVEPVGQYKVQLISSNGTTSTRIQQGNVVLVIGFAESYNLPHMAFDNRYYIRAGAHTSPAKHYIVEALRAKRNVSRPILFGSIRPSLLRQDIFDFTIAAVNNVPAINIRFTMYGLPEEFQKRLNWQFPFSCPMITMNNLYRMEFASYHFLHEYYDQFLQTEIQLKLEYTDLAGENYEDIQTLSPAKDVGPTIWVNPVEKSLQNIHEELNAIRKLLEFQ